MPSVTEVANHALDQINQSAINSIDDLDAKSQRCKRMYDISLTILLEKEVWNFAKTDVQLAEDAIAPINGWLHQYTIPTDCRKPIRLNGDDLVEFEEADGKIYTDAIAPITLRYIRDVTNPNLWTSSFLEAFTAYLASRYAKAFAQDNQKAVQEFQEYKESLGEAIARNGQAGTQPTLTVYSELTTTRRY
jgi:hypothetical protein